jgi:fido (protein-threonine AMPylation protein)
LASVDTLRKAWEEAIGHAAEGEFTEARRRSFRRHAIETGIIEHLYEVDWEVTEALVAEGLTPEVAARAGGLDKDVLAIIRSQYDALNLLADAAGEGRDLSLNFIRELHHAICRSQATYEARDDVGQILELPLHHGAWKQQPSHDRRLDGSILDYVPPERVRTEMERLVNLYDETSAAHPVIRAAWLHHRFIMIHPFEDGNGRVAQALTLLVLLKAHYAPLVVHRSTRAQYIGALDRANDGDLRDLIRLFAHLEIVALRSELERPAEPPAKGAGAVEVARAHAHRLRTLQTSAATERAPAAEALANAIHSRVNTCVEELGRNIRDEFRETDPAAQTSVDSAAPPDPKANFWAAQIMKTAREVDFFANLAKGAWWTRLHLTVFGHTLRYCAVIQKVGHGETGVLAVTAFAEGLPARVPGEDERPQPKRVLRSSTADSVTLVYGDDPAARWHEVRSLLEGTLAGAVANFAQQLG